MSKEKTFLNTREVSEFLNINEKMVYTLVADKGAACKQGHRQMALYPPPC